MNITIEALEKFAATGDSVAVRIIADIKRYSEQKELQVNNEIRGKIGEITKILSNPTCITGRDVETPLAIAEIANEWATLISPDDNDMEIVN